MENQKDRISEYIGYSQNGGGRNVTFAVYNGATPDTNADGDRLKKYEVGDRTTIRREKPNILLTNPSMLEYMLLRPREAKIWKDTKSWLNSNPDNKLLFVIDEAHMYRGSSGGEVALLIRRLFHKLGITRDRVQFILTTASMPDSNDEDRKAVMHFANALTAADKTVDFCYLTGVREKISGLQKYDIAFSKFEDAYPADFEEGVRYRIYYEEKTDIIVKVEKLE
jgi:ATP-dependent helicase YprA (DUF1998 family)